MPAFLKRIESRFLIAWICVAGAVWGFFHLADEIGEGELNAFDRRILLSLRNPADLTDPIGPRSFEEAMRDVTALGGFTVLTLVTVTAILLFLFHRKWRHAAIMAGVSIAAQFASSYAKTAFDRPRPDLVPHGSYVYSASFPSGHSLLSAATYLTLAILIASLETQKPTKVLVMVLAVLLTVSIGASRIYLGVHWPSDVLGGWTLGSAFALAGWTALGRAKR
jgi:undecaprenyl-diphosphatase